MGRVATSLLALALGTGAALALASCGGGESAKLLPGHTADEITSNLDRVKQMVSNGECIGAEDEAQLVTIQIDQLGGVDKRLKQALREGAARLEEVVTECVEETVETVESSEPVTESPSAKPPKKNGNKEGKGKTKTTPVGPPAQTPPVTQTPPTSTPPPATPPAEGGGTGAPPGGVSPGTPAPEGNNE